MEKIETYDEKRGKLFGATSGEEEDLRNEFIEDVGDKINEVIDWINLKGGNK